MEMRLEEGVREGRKVVTFRVVDHVMSLVVTSALNVATSANRGEHCADDSDYHLEKKAP